MYYININQPYAHFLEIEIRLGPKERMGGALSACAVWDFDKSAVRRYVYSYINFVQMTAGRARDVAYLFRVAAAVAEWLAANVKTLDDLKATYTAKVMGRTVVIEREKEAA